MNKLLPHHIDWLNRNDGKYSVIANNDVFFRNRNNSDCVDKLTNKIIFVFRSTQFSFNELGLAQAIDAAIAAYPDS